MQKTDLNMKVLDTTKKSLETVAEEMGVSVGELIDRMALNWEVKDSTYAAQLILEDMILHFSHLEDYQIDEALVIVLNVLKLCDDTPTAENLKRAVEKYFSIRVDPFEEV